MSKRSGSVQVAYRFPEPLHARIKAYQAHVEELTGVKAKETAIVVALLEKGLAAVEAEQTKRRK